ncbi:hypothetical protein BV20DRAFT_599817 [Pilatotrama ljubarskyi]|nr:hypothetical protein BV20DRAFT_599817 [Pilatotrama ljubarskyi]
MLLAHPHLEPESGAKCFRLTGQQARTPEHECCPCTDPPGATGRLDAHLSRYRHEDELASGITMIAAARGDVPTMSGVGPVTRGYQHHHHVHLPAGGRWLLRAPAVRGKGHCSRIVLQAMYDAPAWTAGGRSDGAGKPPRPGYMRRGRRGA